LNKLNFAILAWDFDREENDSITITRMFSIVGQFLALHGALESALSLLGLPDIDGQRAEYILRLLVSKNVAAAIMGKAERGRLSDAVESGSMLWCPETGHHSRFTVFPLSTDQQR
jgi:hypothetical protein